MRYFAYGSNMCTGRLRYRVPHCAPEGVARLAHHTLRFHKHSNDGSGKCNAFFTGITNNEVLGVVFEIPVSEIRALSRAEGLGHGYHIVSASLTLQGESAIAQLYVADPDAIDDNLHPYSWYRDFVLAGAQEHNISHDYVERFSSRLCLPQSILTPNANKASVLK